MVRSLVLSAVRAYDLLTINGDVIVPSSALEATGRTVRFGMIAAISAVVVFLIGGSLAPLESASVLHGEIMPEGYKKAVQHLEGGIVESILVKNGDEVVQGQPLVRLSKVGAAANQGVVATQYFTARVTQARLEALQGGQDDMVLKDGLEAQANANPELQDILKSQQQLFVANRDAERDKLAMYSQQIAQLHEEKNGLEAQLKSAREQFGYVDGALKDEKSLVEQGLSTRPRLLSLESQDTDLQGKIGELTASVGKNQKQEMEIEAKIANEKSEFQSTIAQDLRNARESAAELEKKLAAASDVLQRTVITAPVSGIVNDLKYHTPGGVIPPGDTIMYIVPKDGSVLVDAQVRPRDISRVHIGQEAKVMFPTYRSGTTPMVKGKVVQVSADRIIPSQQDGDPTFARGYYLARVEIGKADLKKLATPITLTPGMPVEVLVVDGKRSLLGYYIKPFTDSFQRAFREP